MIAAVAVSLFSTDLLMKWYINDLDVAKTNGEDIYQYPFDNISGQLLDKYGGWFEIVNELGESFLSKETKKTISSITKMAKCMPKWM
ncbi:hypothetical protein ACE3MQ_26910 [Paenibacillus lentus]